MLNLFVDFASCACCCYSFSHLLHDLFVLVSVLFIFVGKITCTLQIFNENWTKKKGKQTFESRATNKCHTQHTLTFFDEILLLIFLWRWLFWSWFLSVLRSYFKCMPVAVESIYRHIFTHIHFIFQINCWLF